MSLQVVKTEETDIDGMTNTELMQKQQDELKAASMNAKFLAKITAGHEKLSKIKTQRDKLNKQKAEVISNLVDMGLDRNALKAAIAYADTPPDKRGLFDLSYAATRKALGVPLQDDLFVAQVQHAVDAHKGEKQD